MNVSTLDRLDRLKTIASLASRVASASEYLIERHAERRVVVGY
jgi:hypothetical protein